MWNCINNKLRSLGRPIEEYQTQITQAEYDALMSSAEYTSSHAFTFEKIEPKPVHPILEKVEKADKAK